MSEEQGELVANIEMYPRGGETVDSKMIALGLQAAIVIEPAVDEDTGEVSLNITSSLLEEEELKLILRLAGKLAEEGVEE